MKKVLMSCIFVLASSGYLHAEDCTKKFTIGEYGIPQSDSIAAGLPYGKQYEPVYMEKQKVDDEPDLCRYISISQVFQLKFKREGGFLLAGCYGDFNSDGKRDYALLVKNIADKTVHLRVFIHAPDGYRVIPLEETGAPHKDEVYIPSCERKPPDGIFVGLEEQKYKVTGDLIHYGWYTYFWEGNDLKQILTGD